MRRAFALLPILATVTLAAPGCVQRGYFTDGTSLSFGKSTRGVLLHGRELPAAGTGYLVPPTWIARGSLYGVDELVDAVQRASARVAERLPGGTLGVGDLSSRGGGRAIHHKSHENGRDVDLIFYAIDWDGAPLPPANVMPRYNRRLVSRPTVDDNGAPLPLRRFDVGRNWSLVAALLEDPQIDVQSLFVALPLRRAMLEYAWYAGEKAELIARARAVLKSPGRRAFPHDDHMHMRIRCPENDKGLGCVDEGRVRLRVEKVKGPKIS